MENPFFLVVEQTDESINENFDENTPLSERLSRFKRKRNKIGDVDKVAEHQNFEEDNFVCGLRDPLANTDDSSQV